MTRAGRILAVAALMLLMSGATAAAGLSGIVVTTGASPSQVPGARVILFDPDLTIFLEARTD